MADADDTALSADVGEDWVGSADERSTRGVARTGADRPAGGSESAEAELRRRGSYWSVLLQTFPASVDGHQTDAVELIRRMSQIDPSLAQSFIHTDDRGSMVLYGRHASVDGDGAQSDLAYIKGVAFREQPLFPRAMLTRIRLKRDVESYGDNELLSLRVAYPQFRELFTYQIGVWGTFREYARRGERTMSWEEVQRASEANVRELRSKGYQAYFHHDADKELSMVTIGVFDGTAYDAQSGLYVDPRLDRLSREFSAHLINGEEVLMQMGRREVPQKPLLVLVPDLP